MDSLIREEIKNLIVLYGGNAEEKDFNQLKEKVLKRGVTEENFEKEYNEMFNNVINILDDITRFRNEIINKIKSSRKNLSTEEIEHYCAKGKELGLSKQFIEDEFIPFILQNYKEDFFQEESESETVIVDEIVLKNIKAKTDTHPPEVIILNDEKPIQIIHPTPPIIHVEHEEEPNIEELPVPEPFFQKYKGLWTAIFSFLLFALIIVFLNREKVTFPPKIELKVVQSTTDTNRNKTDKIDFQLNRNLLKDNNVKMLISEIIINKDNIEDTKSIKASVELSQILKDYKLKKEDKNQLIETKNIITKQINSSKSQIKDDPNDTHFHQSQILKWQNINNKIEEILKLQ